MSDWFANLSPWEITAFSVAFGVCFLALAITIEDSTNFKQFKDWMDDER